MLNTPPHKFRTGIKNSFFSLTKSISICCLKFDIPASEQNMQFASWKVFRKMFLPKTFLIIQQKLNWLKAYTVSQMIGQNI